MNLYSLFSFSRRDVEYVISALIISSLIFYSVLCLHQLYAQTSGVTLSATVATALTFTTTTDQFGTITPGTYKIATTTLDVTTNSANGYIISLSGDNKNASNNNLQLSGETSTQITDQTQWIPGAATTSAGNAVVRGSLDNSGNVLAFRVMSASSTNSYAFLSPTWWGTTDADGTAKFAGIASSSVQRTIGNAGAGSYSASRHVNTVQYYLNVGASQKTGTYSAPLTYTATGN
jgi:hypothetical protein